MNTYSDRGYCWVPLSELQEALGPTAQPVLLVNMPSQTVRHHTATSQWPGVAGKSRGGRDIADGIPQPVPTIVAVPHSALRNSLLLHHVDIVLVPLHCAFVKSSCELLWLNVT